MNKKLGQYTSELSFTNPTPPKPTPKQNKNRNKKGGKNAYTNTEVEGGLFF